MDKAAKAKEDIEATTGALTADQEFLIETTKGCATEDKLYAQRSATRNQEITALSETLDILTGDEARSLFDKTISFTQLVSASKRERASSPVRISKVSDKAVISWLRVAL